MSREAATTIVALAGLAMLSFIGASIWFVKKKRRRIEPPAALPTQQPAPPPPPNYIPSSAGSSLASGTSTNTEYIMHLLCFEIKLMLIVCAGQMGST
jgi:LPXTG-motif cell wall-anchored protein